MNWNEPAIFNETTHIEAAETKQQFQTGWFANPIFVNGKYPDIMRERVKNFIFSGLFPVGLQEIFLIKH